MQFLNRPQQPCNTFKYGLAIIIFISFLIENILAEYDCSAKDDGWYYDPEFCHIYWRCIHGTSEEFECASGTAWDHHENRCNWLDNVDCSRAEKTTVKPSSEGDDEPDGNGKTHHDPGEGEGESEDEDRPTVVKKPKKKKKKSRRLNSDKPILNGKNKDGIDHEDPNASIDFLCVGRDGFFAHPEYCTRYYRCSHGLDEVFECPRGTAWDDITKACAWVEQVDCQEKKLGYSTRTTTEDTTTSNKKSVSEPVASNSNVPSVIASTNGKDGGSAVIECQPTGIYSVPDPAECNAYYQCDKGIRTRVICAEKTFFDTEKRECVEFERASCGTRTVNAADKNQCANKRDGIHADTERDCHYYYKCVAKNKLREAKCAGDQKFNTFTARCGPASSAPAPCGSYVPGNFATKNHQTIYIFSVMMALFVIFHL